MKIAIVDDDRQLSDRLMEYMDALLAGSCEWLHYPSGEAFLAAWTPGMCDRVILDIFMGGVTGMDVAREIRRSDREVKLVFCTTSNEFASESYEVNACYYLHKPLEKGRVKAMLDRIDLAQLEQARTVQLPDGTAAVLRDIVYADSAAHYVTLHCRRGKSIRVQASLGDVVVCFLRQCFPQRAGDRSAPEKHAVSVRGECRRDSHLLCGDPAGAGKK